MAIWFSEYPLDALQRHNDVNMLKHLDFRIEEVGPDYLVGSLPVDHRTMQPFGILHGGASVVLAESLGSIGANMIIDPNKQYAVGLEVNANHVRSLRGGRVYGTAKPIHVGKATQVWEIILKGEDGKVSAISRLTMAVLDHKKGN